MPVLACLRVRPCADRCVGPEPHDETERKIFETLKEALDEAPKQLELLKDYHGCEEPIRKARLPACAAVTHPHSALCRPSTIPDQRPSRRRGRL